MEISPQYLLATLSSRTESHKCISLLEATTLSMATSALNAITTLPTIRVLAAIKKDYIILREKTNIYVRGNRMVVNADNNGIEQTTHYYPYGGIIGNLSSNQEAQKYKYSGKELDRTYGLDLYDFHARLFNPALPVFDRPDPLAEKHPEASPYAYCIGNPIMWIDPTGLLPDSVEAAQMAKHVYNKEKVELVGGWNCTRLAFDDKTGLQYGVYQRCNGGENIETCIVFAGTNDGTDAQLDLDQYKGMGNEIWDTQYGQAALLALSQMASLAPGEELSFAGHSLGGALAQVASMMTDAAAITFNPAGIHNNTMTELGLVGSNTTQIQNYVISGEIVSASTMSNPNVNTYGNTSYRSYNYCPSSSIHKALQRATNHQINNF